MSDTENATVSPKSTKKAAPIAEPEPKSLPNTETEELLYSVIYSYAGSAKAIGIFTLSALIDRYPGLKESEDGDYVDRDESGNGITAIPFTPIRE